MRAQGSRKQSQNRNLNTVVGENRTWIPIAAFLNADATTKTWSLLAIPRAILREPPPHFLLVCSSTHYQSPLSCNSFTKYQAKIFDLQKQSPNNLDPNNCFHKTHNLSPILHEKAIEPFIRI